MRNTFSCCKTNITIFLRTFSSSPEINFRLEFVLIFFFTLQQSVTWLSAVLLLIFIFFFFIFYVVNAANSKCTRWNINHFLKPYKKIRKKNYLLIVLICLLIRSALHTSSLHETQTFFKMNTSHPFAFSSPFPHFIIYFNFFYLFHIFSSNLSRVW